MAPKALKKGLELLAEQIGEGPPVRKHAFYRIKLKMWLRVDRVFLIGGLFCAIQGMQVGGTRLLRIAPHLAYANEGVQGVIPPNAVLTAELSVISERAPG